MRQINCKYKLSFVFYLLAVTVSLLTVGTLVGCSDDKNELQNQYGYVQFKLYKTASYDTGDTPTRATVDRLTLLSDACKIEVVMQHNGSTISQTLVLNSYNAENAEFGLRSDKLQLLVGDYAIIGYNLYDKFDRLLMNITPTGNTTFNVTQGGLTVKALTVDGIPRGMVSFKLVKEIALSRAASDEGTKTYPFSNIKAVDVTVLNTRTQISTTFEKIRVTYTEDFKEGPEEESKDLGYTDNAETSYAKSDTILWLEAGTYQITKYTTYSDKNATKYLEVKNDMPTVKTFTVEDNVLTKDVEVPIYLSRTAECIKDYIALKAIWEALDGKNWKYYGEACPMGCNWNFNKDIDMWGDQPGVNLDANGRVTTMTLAGFGAKGVVPYQIGQLTELTFLALGSHDEKLGGHLWTNVDRNMTSEQRKAFRMDYDTRFLARDIREGFSKELKEAINDDIARGEYPGKGTSVLKRTITPIQSTRPMPKDIQFGSQTNSITGISIALKRLKKLEIFYIANSPIEDEGFFVDDISDISNDDPYASLKAEKATWKWDDFEFLTDIEIYNCYNITRLPDFLYELPEIIQLNLACNQKITGEQLNQDWKKLNDSPSGGKVQILYLGYNNLKEFPDNVDKMTHLGMIDCVHNKINKLYPFGKDINLAKCYLDYNEISEIPGKEVEGSDSKYFFGYVDVESFTCSHNKLKYLPNIFNAKSVYTMAAVDFSYNEIGDIDGNAVEDESTYAGINVSELNLSYNRIEKFPGVLFQTGSPLNSLVLSNNRIARIEKGAFDGKYSHYLLSLDMSYNKLTEFSNEFNATRFPYFYGIDLSYNSFTSFPYAPLDIPSLVTYVIQHQRDDKGNRTLKEWPQGIYKCPSMQRLFLGHNDLRKIDDTISPYIFILQIEDNPNISIDMSSVCPYIRSGQYMLIYDKTQDIRGCDALDLDK